jgi:hypothetical protein
MRCRAAIALVLVIAAAPMVRAEDDKPADSKSAESKEAKDIEIVGQIVPADVPDKERRHPCKIHTLTFEKDKAYIIDLISRDFDCWLRVADADGKTLAQDDDGGDGLNSRLRFVPANTGGFQVVATSFAGGAGTYVLKVRVDGAAGAAGATGKPAVKPLPLKFDDGKAEFQGQLNANDAPDPVRNHPAKVHTLKMAKDKTYVIELQSTDFDSYLRLEDADGKQLANDDDGGGFPNARLRFTAPRDGEYRIIATSFNAKTGRYTLKIVSE